MPAKARPTQRARLARLLATVLPRSPFYARKLADHGGANLKPEDLPKLPATTKQELIADQEANPPYGTNLTRRLSDYVRLTQTSGTTGTPLRWLDTASSWDNMLNCWRQIYGIVEVQRGDRVFFPFSFGPFLGFWTAFEAAQRLGCLCLPAGGMSGVARLKMLLDNRAQVMLCTPTYALHLAQVAAENAIDIRGSLTKIIVAGEPGGSIPATRQRIEDAWGARLLDHSGLTEVGPMTIECLANPGGLHLLEDDYIGEVVDPATLTGVPPGTIGELLVTNLGREGSPVLRYRTGDLVRVDPNPCPCGLSFLRYQGGILGRTDDMIPIRGNNFYPSALENVLRRFAEMVEYRVRVDATNPLVELKVEIEPTATSQPDLAQRVAAAIRDELLFRAEVKLAPPGSLPRFEMKSKRIHRVGS